MTLPAKATTDFRSESDPRDRLPLDATRICRVCGDAATGMYFGALVCVPCKTFFLRYAGDGFSYECKYSKTCEITTATRTQCKFCRYQKCLRVGMCRRVRPAQIEAQDGQQLCVVCQDVANGVHFGVLTCEGCKKFFRRGLVEQRSYRCRNDQNCSINPSNRNACRFCRFKKCLKAGMSREAIQMGRPSKMSVFENSQGHRVVPQPRDHQTDPHPIRPNPSDPFSYRPAGLDPSSDQRASTTAPFPSWMEDPLLVAPGECGRNPWTQIETIRGQWNGGLLGGPVVPLVGKGFSPIKVTPDDPEGDRSDGSACPDSTMVREEVDPFLPIDFTRSFTSGEEEYLHDWTDGGSTGGGSNFRSNASVTAVLTSGSRLLPGTTSPVAMTTTLATACKLEVLTSEDDEDDGGRLTSGGAFKRNRFDDDVTSGGGGSGAFKRSRYDDCLLPTQGGGGVDGGGGCFDLRFCPGGHGPGKLDDIPCMAGLCGGGGSNSDDVSSSGIVGRAFADVLRLPADVGNPISGLDDDQGLGGCGSAAASGFLAQTGCDVRIGSPSVSSSSCPLDLLKTEKMDVQAGQGQGQGGGELASGAFGSGCTCQMTSGKGFLSSERSEVNRDWRETGHAGSQGPDRPRGSSTVEEVGNQCWQTIKGVIPAYHRFVNSGTVINNQLKQAYQSWKKENHRSDCADELSLWIQTTVVPAYTTISVTYCKSLPDFTTLSPADQRTLIAGGQSESRILVAAIHWYDASERLFRNFLSWREDCPQRPDSFKAKLRDFADRISKLHLDPIEAALLNAVGVFSTDYPNLKDRKAIEESRSKIMTTMRSYIASNNSAPGERLETLFRVLREAQSLGAEHVALTNTRTLGLSTASSDTKGNDPETSPGHSTDQVVTTGLSDTCQSTNHAVPTDPGQSLTSGIPSNGKPLDGELPNATTVKSSDDGPTTGGGGRDSPICDLPLKKPRRENSPPRGGELPPADDSLPAEILPGNTSQV